MFDDPLTLSQKGLSVIPDDELAAKINEALESIKDLKNRGIDSSVQEKVYEAYTEEFNRRSKNDAPTKPHGLKAVE